MVESREDHNIGEDHDGQGHDEHHIKEPDLVDKDYPGGEDPAAEGSLNVGRPAGGPEVPGQGPTEARGGLVGGPPPVGPRESDPIQAGLISGQDSDGAQAGTDGGKTGMGERESAGGKTGMGETESAGGETKTAPGNGGSADTANAGIDRMTGGEAGNNDQAEIPGGPASGTGASADLEEEDIPDTSSEMPPGRKFGTPGITDET